jgi:L-lactate utilization protein LutB
MTPKFDNFFNTLLEQIDTQTMFNLLHEYQKRIRHHKIKITNYEAESQFIDKQDQLKHKAIAEYRKFINLNKEELYKNGFGPFIEEFNKELKTLERF